MHTIQEVMTAVKMTQVTTRKKQNNDETEASSLVKCNDTTVIRNGDVFQYYLVKLKKNPFLRDSDTKYGHGYTFPPMTKIIVVNYYWHFKQVKEGAKAAVISFFSLVGVCPEFFRN